MKTIWERTVHDLYYYSGVRANDIVLKRTDIKKVLANIVDDLHMKILDTRSSGRHNPLPTILAGHTQRIQIFQNLIDYATN